jgi:hypothetical protein
VLNRSLLSPEHNWPKDKVLYNALFEYYEDKWIDTFNHELFHAVDRTLGKANGGRYLSEMIKEFSEPGAGKITKYAERAQLAYETAAETFMQYMKMMEISKMKYGKFFEEKFLKDITDSPYKRQFEILVENYIK